METLGDRLKRARERSKHTQNEVCKALGISIGTLSGYERDYRKPDTDVLAKLANHYDVSIDYLVTGKTLDPAEIDPEQAEFLRWVEENLEEAFFYDFKRSSDEQKEYMMETLRLLWQREQKRNQKRSE
ncbi:helix-turn-helix domain-containing protein [Alicyclobacillus sp. SO9]|uniref:helix-turn-helix domain-containing protein n=1 Tax=Alicyclobacillus sp. SO9 TaxID=2665646 RepID=UPI0018E8C91E|nr:helix-turn-helix transcriptional regulator [Alicyclobacillus sp. SO9]QQE79629.1 helix-turn-helix transcriptional regulator [Alicyclobacillus sp. SO9]